MNAVETCLDPLASSLLRIPKQSSKHWTWQEKVSVLGFQRRMDQAGKNSKAGFQAQEVQLVKLGKTRTLALPAVVAHSEDSPSTGGPWANNCIPTHQWAMSDQPVPYANSKIKYIPLRFSAQKVWNSSCFTRDLMLQNLIKATIAPFPVESKKELLTRSHWPSDPGMTREAFGGLPSSGTREPPNPAVLG